MKKYEFAKNNDFLIHTYDFNSLSEFLYHIENTIFAGILTKQSSIYGDYSFCKTNSLAEAIDYCKRGYCEDYSKILLSKINLDQYLKTENITNVHFNDVCGYLPDIPAFVTNRPDCMINQKSNVPRETITIYYNVSYPADVKDYQLNNMAVAIYSLIDYLTKANYNVNLNILELCSAGNEYFLVRFNLKREGQLLNIRALDFAMRHPSFLRRLVFRLQEVTPNLNKGFCNGYGCPATSDDIKKVLGLGNNDIFISFRDFDIAGKDIKSDADIIYKKLKLK